MPTRIAKCLNLDPNSIIKDIKLGSGETVPFYSGDYLTLIINNNKYSTIRYILTNIDKVLLSMDFLQTVAKKLIVDFEERSVEIYLK
ncbi:hypothetical protein DFR86_00845 [Acidianus sulfidivorans JP7]|uniref:Uncharacterized protein n=1 Tax=Acidianus sulfidivorans JP7 TaxID=619593 RepID=A0A2U9IJM9_9CREN|nr:hypothetical protein [Acidianus sulfidivorans]AWR96232.1 hypothetical protein DFR86_00845 [Acidianus sulfidivorans JP7]